MSQIQDKVHLYLKAIANGARDRAAASSRNLDRRLKRTRLTLASLHVSEKHERTALATAIKARSAAAQAGGTLKRAEAAGDLEIDTHRSNLTAIERQIQLVGMAVQYLERRTGSGEKARQSEIHVPLNLTPRVSHINL